MERNGDDGANGLDVKLAKREQRLRLEFRKKPYWLTLNEGEHLGYYRGARVGKWVARHRRPGAVGNYQEMTIAEADDTADADGAVISDFRQAQVAARQWFASLDRSGGRRVGNYTVSDGMTDYLAGFSGKDLLNTRSRVEAIIRPTLGDYDISKLTASVIADWLSLLANSPARLRTRQGLAEHPRDSQYRGCAPPPPV